MCFWGKKYWLFWSQNGSKHTDTHIKCLWSYKKNNNNNNHVYSKVTTSRDHRQPEFLSVWLWESVWEKACTCTHTARWCLCVCVMTRLRESVSSLHLPSPWWLTAELIPRLTPRVDWRAHVYTQTELTKGWNTFTGWWHQMIHSEKKAFIVKHTQT